MKLSVISILAVAIASTACVGIDGSGERATRTSEPGDFEGIALTGGFASVDVQVCGECEPRVKVTGDSRQLDDVIIMVDDGVLELRHRSRLVLTDIDLQAVIRVPTLSSISQSGSSDVVVTGVSIERFEATSSGSGDVSIEGSVDSFESISSGSGRIEAFNLESNVVDVTLSGSGDAEVCAKRELRARSTGSGNVFYDCNPEVTDFDATGSGRFSVR